MTISRAQLYESDDVEITDEDVEEAIAEAVDRFGDEGAEIESLLRGETPPEPRSRIARILFRQTERWFWDKANFRYINEAGQFFAGSELRSFVDRSINLSGEYLTDLSERFADGQITRAQYNEAFREELKREYIRQYMLGRGGYEQMTQRDWGSIGGSLKEQYKYIDGFADDLLSGKASGGAIANRSDMYANSAREAHNRARDRMTRAWGAVEELWYTTSGNSCDDCLEYESLGWQPVGTFPEPGQGATICLTKCRCGKDKRNDEGEIYEG